MPSCTFFGHRDCPVSIKPQLQKILVALIEHHDVDVFYVGSQGNFDQITKSVLRDLSARYPHIQYAVVLAYMPHNHHEASNFDYSDTMLPAGIETAHPRFAISWRNKWMIKQSDYVITYITHSWGGAAQFSTMAAQQDKMVINLFKE